MNEITADTYTLLRQASGTARDYLAAAITNVDELLGEGYAAAHPELLAAMVASATADFNNAHLQRRPLPGLPPQNPPRRRGGGVKRKARRLSPLIAHEKRKIRSGTGKPFRAFRSRSSPTQEDSTNE
jgi:hypothetical protein